MKTIHKKGFYKHSHWEKQNGAFFKRRTNLKLLEKTARNTEINANYTKKIATGGVNCFPFQLIRD